MNRLTVCLAITIIYLLTTDCIHLRINELSDDDKKWILNPINSGISTDFISNMGNRAHMNYTKSDIFTPTHDFYVSEANGCTTLKEAMGLYNFDINIGDEIIDGKVAITKDYSTDSLKIVSFLRSYIGGRYTNFERYSGISLTTQSVSIGDSIFHSCFVVDSINSKFNNKDVSPQNVIKKYIISKEYGLIYYEFESGEYFVRQFD